MNRRVGKTKIGRMSTRAKLIFILLIIAFALAFFLVRYTAAKKERVAVAQGRQRLLEIDTDEALLAAENAYKKKQAENIKKRLEASINGSGKDNGMDPWSYFNDSVILGDSRAVGFYVFEYLPQSRVFAAGGNTIKTIADSMDDMKALNPSVIFLSYGLNDTTSGWWDSPEDWTKDYGDQVESLQKAFPKSTICVCSILPTSDKALSVSERVKLIPEYEKALKEYCAKNQILFVDCEELAEQHTDMIDPVDGFHYKKEFYPYWAAEMIMTAYIGDGDTQPSDQAESDEPQDLAGEESGT